MWDYFRSEYGSNYKGSKNGPFNDEEIDEIKERMDEALEDYDDEEYGMDGVEQDWRNTLYELKEVEELRIEEFVNNYIRKYVVGNEEPDRFSKEELSDALACYAEMELFTEEHYDSKEEYEHPNANLIWMINQFVEKAMDVITNKEKIGEKSNYFKELVSTENKSPVPLYEGGDIFQLVQVGNGEQVVSLYKIGHGSSKLCIQEEQGDKVIQEIYELKDGEDYELTETINLDENSHEQNAANLENSAEKSKQLDGEIAELENKTKNRG